MDWLENNALRAAARAVIKEVNAGWEEAGVIGLSTSVAAKKRDQIAREVLDRWMLKLTPKYTKIQLVYTIGVIKNPKKDR